MLLRVFFKFKNPGELKAFPGFFIVYCVKNVTTLRVLENFYMKKRRRFSVVVLCIVSVSCWGGLALAQQIDSQATPETQNLYRYLQRIRGHGLPIGQQEATLRGSGWVNNQKCDMREVSGEYPAIYGWDFLNFEDPPYAEGLKYDLQFERAREAYDRGGINTFSWHMWNPVTGQSFRDQTPAVKEILPGGSKHGFYKEQLQKIADRVKSLRGSDGTLVPILFRPFHEHIHSHFWWGKNHVSREDFIALWRFTVTYLRDTLGVHQFLYVFCPGENEDSEFLDRYPGNEYVDVIGVDNYTELNNHPTGPFAAFGRWMEKRNLIIKMRRLVRAAEYYGKIPAINEFGAGQIPESNYWTERFLNPIASDPVARRVAYAMVWGSKNPEFHFSVYPGHHSAPNFIKMVQNPYSYFESDLKGVYH